jgi:hypothetical protein
MATTLKPIYGASAALTITLNALASDTNLLAGRSSSVVDNTSNLSVDELITGVIKTGTTPTVSTNVLIYAWGILDDTPTYPDTVTGSDANTTLTSANVQQSGAFKLAAVITVDATTGRTYPFSFSLAALFGGNMPKKWGVYVVHNNVAALNAAGNVVSHIPLQYQNV